MSRKAPFPVRHGRTRIALAVAVALGAAGWLFVSTSHSLDPPWAETDSTWTWSGSGYTELWPAHRPSARERSAIVYDPAGRYVLLYGGTRCEPGFRACTDFTDTWEWDGSDWTQLRPPHSPGQPASQLVYDAALGRPVLLTDTGAGWEWTGSDWAPAWPAESLLVPGANPDSLDHRSAGYDEAHRMLVVLSERWMMSAPLTSDYTFTTVGWDGRTWRQLAIASEVGADSGPDDQYGVMAFDRVRNVLVAIGMRKTWAWDGARWIGTRSGTLGLQVEGVLSTLIYDPRLGKAVLFGNDYGERHEFSWSDGDWSVIVVGAAPHVDDPALAFDEARGVVVMFGGESRR